MGVAVFSPLTTPIQCPWCSSTRIFFSVSQVEIDEMDDNIFDMIIEVGRNVMAEFSTTTED